MGIFENPNTWGSSAWVFLYCIANTYPENPLHIEKIQYERFFNDLQFVLPCKKCRTHYQKWLTFSPIYPHLQSRYALKEWLFLLHNYINIRLDKGIIRDYDTAEKIMKKLCLHR